MIKAIITDIDGVIVGKKEGVNFPYPNEKIIKTLKFIRQTLNIPVVLCSGKYFYPILPIIEKAELKNPHITDNGALILDPLGKGIIVEHTLPRESFEKVTQFCHEENIVLECYTSTKYFFEKNQKNLTDSDLETRIKAIGKDPIFVESLKNLSETNKFIKLLAVIKTAEDKEKLNNFVSTASGNVEFHWARHPSMPDIDFGLMTLKGVSKKSAAKEVASILGIPLSDFLGIGDSDIDMEFIEECGYVAAMGDVQDALKIFVENHQNGFVGSDVDNDGLIGILTHFGLIIKGDV